MTDIVIAANGLVGQNIASILQSKGIVFKGYCFKRVTKGCERLDIGDFDEVERVFTSLKPKVVYLCANRPGGVNKCELEREESFRFHVESTIHVGKLCQKWGAKLVFISSDYVFSDRETPYDETDKVSPLNIYGELKVAAENWIRENLDQYLIIRTTNIYGWDPETKTPNYFMGIYRSLEKGNPVKVPSCLYGNPTYAEDLAHGIIDLIEKGENGIFHIVGPENVNRFQWVKKICQYFNFDESLVCELKEIENYPRRPKSICLGTDKLKSVINWNFSNMDEALVRIDKLIKGSSENKGKDMI